MPPLPLAYAILLFEAFGFPVFCKCVSIPFLGKRSFDDIAADNALVPVIGSRAVSKRRRMSEVECNFIAFELPLA